MWITEALKRLYINRVFFAFNMQVSSFNWTPFFAWCCIVSKFRSVHLHCERLLAASKVPWRNLIPLEHKERIVRWFEDREEDYLVIAGTLGVNRSTVQRHRGSMTARWQGYKTGYCFGWNWEGPFLPTETDLMHWTSESITQPGL